MFIDSLPWESLYMFLKNYLQKCDATYKGGKTYFKNLYSFCCCFLPVCKLQEAQGCGSVILEITYIARVPWLPVKKGVFGFEILKQSTENSVFCSFDFHLTNSQI